MRVTPNYMLVEIDKKAQRERREKLSSGIYLSPKYTFMMRNLQHGRIIQIGAVAQKNFPDARPGDHAIFHHTVEDASSIGERLLYEDENVEHRILKGDVDFDIYGFIKPGGTIIAANQHIFLQKETVQFKNYLSSSSIIIDHDQQDDHEQLRLKLDALTNECEKLKQTLQRQTDEHAARDIVMVLDGMYAQRRRMTAELNSSALHVATVVSISPEVSKWMQALPGDKIIVEKPYLYPIELMGKEYFIIPKQYTVAKLNWITESITASLR